MVEVDPLVADEIPWSETLTLYDEARLILYLRLLDAEAAGADWREVAQLLLHRDPDAAPERAWQCWTSHLKRAQWIAQSCYHKLLEDAEPGRAAQSSRGR